MIRHGKITHIWNNRYIRRAHLDVVDVRETKGLWWSSMFNAMNKWWTYMVLILLQVKIKINRCINSFSFGQKQFLVVV